MVQNARVTAFAISELLREKQQKEKKGKGGGRVKLPFPPPRFGLKIQS